MPPSQAIAAYGTLLKRGDGGAPETFSTVAEVRSISGPSLEVDETEVTSHSPGGAAPSSAFREFIATLIDSGEVEFELAYVPGNAQHIGIRQDCVARTTRNWQIVLPGNIQTISFAGFVKSLPFEFPTDDVMMQKVTIRVTGAPTFA